MSDSIIRYLIGKTLIYNEFLASGDNDHEHCNLCGAKFSERQEDLHYGYVTKDNDIWICKDCYEYYKDLYRWEIETLP